MADLSALRDRVTALGELRADLAAQIMVERVQDAAPVNTGELRNSIGVTASATAGGRISRQITCGAEHGRYQDLGTGVYGPEGRRIEGNPLLAFTWKGVDVIVHSVSGSPATRFWSDTVTAEGWSSAVIEAAAL